MGERSSVRAERDLPMLPSGGGLKAKHMLVGVIPKRFSREFHPKSEAKSFELGNDKRRPFPNLQNHDMTGVLIPYRKTSAASNKEAASRISRERKQSNDNLASNSQRSSLD